MKDKLTTIVIAIVLFFVIVFILGLCFFPDRLIQNNGMRVFRGTPKNMVELRYETKGRISVSNDTDESIHC